jgi:hypothetical protein
MVDAEGKKRCPDCDTRKPAAEFPRSLTAADGLESYCRPCKCKRTNAYRARLKAQRLAAMSAPPAPVQTAPEAVSGDVEASSWDAKTEPPVSPPESDPLTQAYEEAAERKEKRETKRQRDALLDENDRLKRTIGELVKLQKPPSVLVYRQPEWVRSDAVACAIASDWHVEEPVEAQSVHGANEFNLEVARKRSEFFFKNLLRLTDIMARESKINTIYIAALGDFFSGWIHEELIGSNLLAPGDAAHFWKGLFISGIDYILRESSYIIEMDGVVGNHGRLTKRVSSNDPAGTSLEAFAYHALADRYESNDRVRIKVASHAMVYRSFFERFVMRNIHGYEIKYGGGVGGITIPIRKKLAGWDKARQATVTNMGHFHTRIDGGDFVVNGSLIGYGPYAQMIGASPEEAQQSFYLIHARKGGVKSVCAPIWLDDAHQHRDTSPAQLSA